MGRDIYNVNAHRYSQDGEYVDPKYFQYIDRNQAEGAARMLAPLYDSVELREWRHKEGPGWLLIELNGHRDVPWVKVDSGGLIPCGHLVQIDIDPALRASISKAAQARRRESRRLSRACSAVQVPRQPRTVTPGVRARVMERDGFRCRRCGRGPEVVALHADHILAVALGGASDMDNLQTLCEDCNIGKRDRQPHPHDMRVTA